MRIIRLLLLFVFVIVHKMSAQKTNVMLTYGQSKFLYSPGIEINHFINSKIGFEVGVSSYFLDYQPNQLVNISTKDNYFFHFYNANIGLCGILRRYEKVSLGWTLGWKIYYGPNFQPLHFFESEGYFIYYDYARGKFNHGLDVGVMTYFNRYITGVKFDTARNNLRLIVGYSF